MANAFEDLSVEAHLLGPATLNPVIEGTPHLYGSGAFFASATEMLVASTREERELGGACYCVEKDGVLVLVGLKRRSTGGAKHVAIDPVWGSVLWHTHPGMSFALAAFSEQDFAGAREADRPLLVIGYRTASPDALGLTQAVGMVSDTDDVVLDHLLRVGVAARVAWPDGTVRPVRRYQASGLREVVDDATFAIDRAMGVAARGIGRVGPLNTLNVKLIAGINGLRRRLRKKD